jgi:hypothetical protein
MASSLMAIVAEMQAALAAAYPTATINTGQRWLDTHGAPPEIVFVPRARTFLPADKHAHNPRALWTRRSPLSVYVWGSDFAATEDLEDAVIRAAHAAAWGSYELEGSDPEPDEWQQHGDSIRLDLAFLIPVTEAPWTTVVPTNFSLTPGTAGDGVLQPGET